ncbi:hypothetical protein MPSI1_003403 [Malassezia psittaci]|uniref:Mitochondrial genome maintenance protein MGM101 n=1 Tax=Malassezia psittaci TaxID=1821823 RepID=A0AAF0F8Q4_9BASI|nr:hypothetical protein MPSI1_003403 [Malassezia psittaci]
MATARQWRRWGSALSKGGSQRYASNYVPRTAAASAGGANQSNFKPSAAQPRSAAQDASFTPAAKPTTESSSVSASSAAPSSEASEIQRAASEIDWSQGYEGIGHRPFNAEASRILSQALDKDDIEIKPDGLLYLPEIKYRRILNRAFGPGGWGMVPRGDLEIGQGIVARDWALVCLGRFVSTARGEQEFFRPSGVSTATEGAKSNALMRCCKDLGVASELWDPRFIRQFKAKHCVEVWASGSDGKKRKLWRRKDDGPLEYPYKETGLVR